MCTEGVGQTPSESNKSTVTRVPVVSSMLFTRYIMVDWSARQGPSPPKPGPNAIWIGSLDLHHNASEERYFQTRTQAFSYLRSVLEETHAEKQRVLLGFDFSLGFPAGLSKALKLQVSKTPWRLLWQEIRDRISDDQGNHNNRFKVAGELNALADNRHEGPWWGVPASQSSHHLNPCSPRFPWENNDGVRLNRLRVTEKRLTGVQESWKLFGIGSVGGQTMVGIPYLHDLRLDAGLSEHIRIWPFETGFTSDPYHEIELGTVVAEIWPGIVEQQVQIAMEEDPDQVRDQAQVRCLCQWLAEQDERRLLRSHFQPPLELGAKELRCCELEEGWILGSS